MIENVKLSENLVERNGMEVNANVAWKPEVKKRSIVGLDEIQFLTVNPWTSIKAHGHNGQWEVWIRPVTKKAYVCLKGEEHELINHTPNVVTVVAIKGHVDYSFDDLSGFLKLLGLSSVHGSMSVEETG